MKSILIILPYFGKFPKMFPFWLQSAVNNPTVDFLVLTDNILPEQSNIKVVTMSFEDLKHKIQGKFDFPIALSSPYKLCDFRGAYGDIFSDYTSDYDFWGFGDVDLVYGNIRHFLTDSILSSYKVILGWGHLTLYKNIEECNLFYKTKEPNFKYYKDSFTVEKYYNFDEFLHKGLSDLWSYKYPNAIWLGTPFDDIQVPRLSFNFISVFNKKASNNLIFEYKEKNLFRVYLNENGEIMRESTLYAHFQQRNFMKIETDNYSDYLIIPNSFIGTTDITISKIRRWSKSKNIIRQLWNFKNKVLRRSKIILGLKK